MTTQKKVNGALINGKKYSRTTDFSRDTTATLISKKQKYDEYQNQIEIILKKRLNKLEKDMKSNKEIIDKIKEVLL